MKLALLALLATAAFAQNSLYLTTADSTVMPGSQIVVDVMYSGAEIAGVQFASSILGSKMKVAAGSAATAEAKKVYCNPALFCMVIGYNATQMNSGQVAAFTFNAPSKKGTYQYVIGSALGVSPTGAAIAVTPGAALTITIE
jgi:hypothetical protein